MANAERRTTPPLHVEHDNNTYTITVEPTGTGFQFVFIRRLNPSAVLRFVTPDGKELEKWALHKKYIAGAQ